jgi:hypothetical protein
MRKPLFWVTAAGVALGASRLASPGPAPLCGAGSGALMAPSTDLYCVDLVPRPDLAGAAGIAELGRAESPFDVAVTSDGHQRYDVTVTLTGLPEPSTLGPFRLYVAWVAPPTLEPMVKLGVVGIVLNEKNFNDTRVHYSCSFLPGRAK